MVDKNADLQIRCKREYSIFIAHFEHRTCLCSKAVVITYKAVQILRIVCFSIENKSICHDSYDSILADFTLQRVHQLTSDFNSFENEGSKLAPNSCVRTAACKASANKEAESDGATASFVILSSNL